MREERKSGCERGEREWWRKRGGGKSVGMREERKSGCERRDRVGGGRERVVEKEVREGEREEEGECGNERGESGSERGEIEWGKEWRGEKKRGGREKERVCVRKREGNERGEEGERVWE